MNLGRWDWPPKEKWTFRTHPKEMVVYLVVLAVVMWGVGALGAWAFNAAEGAEAAAPMVEVECEYAGAADGCPSVTKRDRKTARKFRNGKIHRSSGFRPHRVFEKPKAAKKIIVNRIVRLYEKSAAKAEAASSEGGDAPQAIPFEGECQDARCSAVRWYKRIQTDATCVDRGRTYPVDESTCRLPKHPKWGLANAEVREGIGVVFCGGAVVLSVIPQTAGPKRALTAIWGGSYCGWSFWSDSN